MNEKQPPFMLNFKSNINGGFIMEESSRQLEEEKIGKLLLRFSIPIVISILVSELYSMVDTLFVGRNVGAVGIGALVIVFPIQRIIIALSMMIGIGTSTSFARSNGENEIEKSKKIVKNGFTFACFLMTSLSLVIYIFSEKILLGLGASSDILPYAMDYLRIIIIGSTFLSLTIFTSNIMIALGNPRISIISTSIGAICNIIIDYILVVKMGKGVKGAAIATTLSQMAGFAFAYYHLLKVKKEYKIGYGFHLDKSIVLPIILVGLSVFIIEAEDGIVMGVINNLLINTVGDSAIVVLGVISKLYMFLFITMFGISSAMQPIAAYNFGAKNFKRLKEVMRKTTIYATATTAVLWIIGLIFAPKLVPIFVKEPEIINESIKAFRIIIAVFPIISIYYVAIFYFQAMGDVKYAVTVSILRQIMILLPVAIILVKVFNLGAMGVWLAFPISDCIVAIVGLKLIKMEGYELNQKVKKEKEKISKEYILN